MATVWAFQLGNFPTKPSTGWSESLNFNTPRDLLDSLEKKNLRASVDRLAIVCHGDLGGQLLMSGRGAPPTSADVLRDLSTYLTGSAMLTFVSCITGQGPAGSTFLQKVSQQLPGRVIVAFAVRGYVNSWGGTPTNPGNVPASLLGEEPGRGAPRLDPWSIFAKWAYRGKIVRIPSGERELTVQKRCGNPNCPGHKDPKDRCPVRTWSSDPVLVKYDP